MDVKNFLDRYYRGLGNIPRIFYERCQENNIKTAKDLLEFGRRNVLRMKNIGLTTMRMVRDAFEAIGINTF